MRKRISRGIGAILASAAVAATVAGAGHLNRPGRHPARSASLLIPNTSRPAPALPTPLAAHAGDPSGLSAALLAPADLPQLVAGTDAWQETATYVGAGQVSDLPCQLQAADDLGAQTEAYRTYRQATRPGGQFNFYYAAHLVVRFPSPDAAAKAATQVSTWIGQCAEDGYLPSAAVADWATGLWSVTSTVPGPDANPRLGAAARVEGEFAVQLQGSAVSVLYVGTETNGSTPRALFQDSAAKAGARLRA